MPFMGVRSSWLMFAMKSDLAAAGTFGGVFGALQLIVRLPGRGSDFVKRIRQNLEFRDGATRRYALRKVVGLPADAQLSHQLPQGLGNRAGRDRGEDQRENHAACGYIGEDTDQAGGELVGGFVQRSELDHTIGGPQPRFLDLQHQQGLTIQLEFALHYVGAALAPQLIGQRRPALLGEGGAQKSGPSRSSAVSPPS